MRDSKLNPALIDFDAVQARSFSKSKSRHGIITMIRKGIIRILFVPFPQIFKYWRNHYNTKLAAYISLHCIIQWIQIAIFLSIDHSQSISFDDVILPVVLAIFTSTLHTTITASQCSNSNSEVDDEILDTILNFDPVAKPNKKKLIRKKESLDLSPQDDYHLNGDYKNSRHLTTPGCMMYSRSVSSDAEVHGPLSVTPPLLLINGASSNHATTKITSSASPTTVSFGRQFQIKRVRTHENSITDAQDSLNLNRFTKNGIKDKHLSYAKVQLSSAPDLQQDSHQDTFNMMQYKKQKIAGLAQERAIAKRMNSNGLDEDSPPGPKECLDKKLKFPSNPCCSCSRCLKASRLLNASETEFERLNSDLVSDTCSSDDGVDDSQNVSCPQDTSQTCVKPTFILGAISPDSCCLQPRNLISSNGEQLLDSQSDDSEDLLRSSRNLLTECNNNESATDPFEHNNLGHHHAKQIKFTLCSQQPYTGLGAKNMENSLGSSCFDIVSCHVWRNQVLKKHDMSLMDIAGTIVQLVDREILCNHYRLFSAVITVLLALSPLFYHGWYTKFTSSEASLDDATEICIKSMTSNLNDTWSAYFLAHQRPTPAEKWLKASGLFLPRLIFTIGYNFQQNITTANALVILLGCMLRFNVYAGLFFLYIMAERNFQRRLIYAKFFIALTSSKRAKKYQVPHFRLNKVPHIKCWLTLRSYFRKRGPQRSVDTIIAAAFYSAFLVGLLLAFQLIGTPATEKNCYLHPSESDKSCHSHHQVSAEVFDRLFNWDACVYSLGLGLFILRFLQLGTRVTEKYRNLSVLTTEQMNILLTMESKPQKKEILSITLQVLKLAESLLKQVDGPFRIAGWAVNPVFYNVFKLVLLSCFSTLLSDSLGFKLKLYKLKINPANW